MKFGFRAVRALRALCFWAGDWDLQSKLMVVLDPQFPKYIAGMYRL